MDINLKHLEVFYAVMTNGSLTNAASMLHISQPAASKAIKLAEHRLGLVLFERVKGKLHPTKEAYILFEKMKPIYNDLKNLNKLAHNLANNPHGRITIGCLPSLGLSIIPHVTAQFVQNNAGVFVTIGTFHTDELEQQLLHRQLDLAITFAPELDTGLISTPIIEIPLVYIDAKPTVAKQPIKMQKIDEKRWIHPNARSLAGVINKYRLFENSVINVQTYYMAAEFVKQGVGCSITDLFTASYMLPSDMIYPLEPSMSVQVCLLRHEKTKVSKMTQDYIDILKKSFEEQLSRVNQML